MLDGLIEFYKSGPVNHWSTRVILTVALVLLVYIIFFYFRKSGRDERGRTVFARASLISFVTMIIWLFLLMGPLFPFAISSAYATAATILFTTFLLTSVQALGLFVINKLI